MPFWTQTAFWGLFISFHSPSLEVAPDSMRWRTRSLRRGLFVLVHPSQHSTVPWPVFIQNSNREWRAEGMWGAFGFHTCHPGGSKSQILPQGPRLQEEGTSGSAPTFASSTSNSYMSFFPQNFPDKGYKKSIYGHKIRVPSTTEGFASEACVEQHPLSSYHRRTVVLTDGIQLSSQDSRVLSRTLTAV